MKFFIAILVLCSLTIYAKEEQSYRQYETILLTPDYKHLNTLSDNMAKHNKKYHSKDPYKAFVIHVVTGTDTGKFYWGMGPSTFSHMDKRPSADGHDEDWADNVMPYLTNMEHGEYWRLMDGMIIDNRKDKKKSTETWGVRYLSVNRGKGDNIKYLLSKIKATLESTGKVTYWAVYDNYFTQGVKNGRHIQARSALPNWAALDEDWEFKKHFIKVHGEGSWDPFWDQWNETFSNSWEEIQSLDKKMSGIE